MRDKNKLTKFAKIKYKLIRNIIYVTLPILVYVFTGDIKQTLLVSIAIILYIIFLT